MRKISGGRVADQYREEKQKLDKTRSHKGGSIANNKEREREREKKNRDYTEQELTKG